MSLQMISAHISLYVGCHKPTEKPAKNRTAFENMVIRGGSAILLLLIVWATVLNFAPTTDNGPFIALGVVLYLVVPFFVLTLIVMFLDTQFNNKTYKKND